MVLLKRFCVTKFVLQYCFAHIHVHGLISQILIDNAVVNLIMVCPQSLYPLFSRIKYT